MKEFDFNAAVVPGIADVTLGMALSAQDIRVSVNYLAPKKRGKLIVSQANLRDASIMGLDGPVTFDPPPATRDKYVERLEHYICWHPSVATRMAACQIVNMEDLAGLADDLLVLRSSARDFVDACLALSLGEAEEMITARLVAEDDLDLAHFVLSEMRIVHRAFVAQRMAAWAWRVVHAPFDNLLDEANFKESGYATIAGGVGHINSRRSDAATVLKLYDSGLDDVDDAEMPFLEKYHLGNLRKPKVRQRLLDELGETRIVELQAQLKSLRAKHDQNMEILTHLKDEEETCIPFADKPKKRLSGYIYAGSLPCDLGMACAILAEEVDGVSLPFDQAPAWLFGDRDEGDPDFVSGKNRFLQVYLFYRRVFFPDGLPKDLERDVDAFIEEDRSLSESIQISVKRACRLILEDMKMSAKDGTFGSRSSLMSQACAAGFQTYWQAAS